MALASLAAGGALAQSTVNLYGVADAGLEYVNKQPGNGDSVFRMQSGGGLMGSRWGMRGTEDLGNGLKAIFVLESGFAVDTGGSDGALFGRQAYVGLQGEREAVTLGRQQTLLYDFALRYDPMASTSRYAINAMDDAFASRASNAAKYIGRFDDFTLSALYSFGYNGQSGVAGEVPGHMKVGRELSVGVDYSAGNVGLGAVYDQVNGDSTATEDRHDRRATLAGSYAFGAVKAFAGYRWSNLQFSPAVGNGISHLFWGGLNYQTMPALTLGGAIYYQGNRGTSADPWLFALSSTYAMSKRTDLYINAAYALNKTDSARAIQSVTSVNGGAEVLPGASQFGASVGIRHRF